MPAGTPRTTPTIRPAFGEPASQPTSAPTPITARVTTIRRAPASAGGNERGAAGSIGAEHSAAVGARDYVTAESRLTAAKYARLCRKSCERPVAAPRRSSGLGARQLLAAADERVRELDDLEQVDDVDRRREREQPDARVDRDVRPGATRRARAAGRSASRAPPRRASRTSRRCRRPRGAARSRCSGSGGAGASGRRRRSAGRA